MSEHDARTSSDPTSDTTQPQSPDLDVTAQVPVADAPTESIEVGASDAGSGEAPEVVEVSESVTAQWPAPQSSAAEPNILEVSTPEAASAYSAPAYGSPAQPTGPVGYGTPPAYAAPGGYPQQGAPGYGTAPTGPTYGAPATPLTPENERQIGALAHGVAAAATAFSGGTLGFVAALVVYLIYKDRGPFVRAQAANALNVQIMTGIGLIISAVLMIVLIGFITYPIVVVFGVVLHIIGAVKAWNGEWWTPPLTPQFVK